MPARSAIVIGGGIGGLSAALYLRRAGLAVSVFESEEHLSEIDTGVTLWAFAIRRLQELGLAEELTEIGRPFERVLHCSRDGRSLGEVSVGSLSARIGAPSYEIHRAKLQALLASALGHDRIVFDRRCTGFEQDGSSVRAMFADGEMATADLLIGADGVHSAVRDAVVGQIGLRRGQIGVWRGIAPLRHDELLSDTHVRIMGTAGLFGVAKLSDDLLRWYAGAPFPPSRPQSGRERKQAALDQFGGWPQLVVDTLGRTAEHDYLFNDTPHARPFRPWGHDRVTLLGDAAHCSLPTLGISAGLAIEDAATLGESLRLTALDISGLRVYERQRQRVTARVVRAARLFGRVLMIPRGPAATLRDSGIRLAPQAVAIRWLAGGGTWRTSSCGQ